MVDELVDPDSSLWAWLAHDVRFYRKKYGLTLHQLATVVQSSGPNVSNIEAGRRKLTDEQALALDVRFKTGGHFSRLLRFARRGHDPDWFKQYAHLEAKARLIKTYQALTVPGLLQTPEYATELFRAVGRVDIEGPLSERMTRADIFKRSDPPLLWAIVTESVIDWPIGGPEVMRKQLAHLLDLSTRPNISVRVVPRAAGTHAGIDGSFSLISGNDGDVVYTESPGGGRLVADSGEIREFGLQYDRIGQSALPESASREMIRRVMEAL
ncbi:helix-turn-helix domain-containing protein [Actinoallomurus iriomotensis]|uniref:Transcriptional regulator n=1 Tax=Actinoallomurus iriomotensis TaxID=478107 RepID=A0A9W6RZQ6_9ACTN|nr:Scr1 family TA system antitoxin-like transcriptional regulator [Actinoallomurus iriomotensis]GLY85796.1 transcriptional regulator [Actinoallomurus iriomotensis]